MMKKKDIRRHRENAQTAIEYMLLLGVVVAIVLIAMKVQLPQVKRYANEFFNRTGAGIVDRPNPCGDGYCCVPFEDADKCPPDCLVPSPVMACP